MPDLLSVLAVIFMLIVAPLWLLFHYLSKWRTQRTLSAADQRLLAELWQGAGRMEQRIQTLERLLDLEAPGWRQRL